jgi:hypothetical protein
MSNTDNEDNEQMLDPPQLTTIGFKAMAMTKRPHLGNKMNRSLVMKRTLQSGGVQQLESTTGTFELDSVMSPKLT